MVGGDRAILIAGPTASGIANPGRPAITDAVLAEARRVLATEHQPRILHGEVAAEIRASASTASVMAGRPGFAIRVATRVIGGLVRGVE
jgi:phosphoserine phosphatase